MPLITGDQNAAQPNDSLSGTADPDTIEGLTGNDTLEGGGGFNLLFGGVGNDSLVGGPDGNSIWGNAGDDTIVGGIGIDTVTFQDSTRGVVANLATGAANEVGTAAGSSGSDSLSGIENLEGTDFADTLIGSAGANTLNGQAGADSIDGGAGDDSIVGAGGHDTVSGGEGNDTIEGGGGVDTAVYSAGRSAYTVTSAVGGGLQIGFSADNSQDFVDIVRDVEFFQFSNGTFAAEDLLASQNQAPTAVIFANVVALTENAAIPDGGIKVADIVVTDDGQGTNTLGLSGADAASFAITGTGLFYVGGSPDFETKPSYEVTVTATDTGLGTGASGTRSIAVTNVAETFSPFSPDSGAAASLANAILAGVPGIAINAGSVLYTGADGQGSFYDGSIAGLGIGAGVLLTSGDGTPPLTNTSASYGDSRGGAGDADLTTVLSQVFNGTTLSYDANVLSFTFTVSNPSVTSISLNAIFATDEYPDFVDNYVDIAAVFVNGVNYAFFEDDPGRPLSLLGDNISYFRNNATGTIPLEYDGISIPLSIVAPVTQGVNTIKIAVADTNDSAYDSALFIGSLTGGTGGGGGIVTPAVYEISGTPTTTEGGTLTFTVSRDVTGTAATVSYSLTGTAGGGDYTVAPLPAGEISFAENELTKTIVLTTVSDALPEGTETVTVTLTQATNGGLISQTNGATTASIFDGNQAPTAVVLSNTVATLAENTAVPGGPGGGIRVADIAVTDDALGANVLSLTGPDAASFELRGNALYFVGASPDFEAKASYAVTVVATDASLSAGAQQAFTLAITDVYEAPPPVVGSSGNDTLFGLGDAFTLSGGDGDDTYVIDSADDDVIETPTGGIERVYTRFSGTTLADNVENMVLETGVADATGNAGDNEIAANASANLVDGAGGNDTITGLAGNDTLLGGLGLDRLFGGDGDDSVDGGADADEIIGGGGNDTLVGGTGDDTLWGEDGNDSLAGSAGDDQLIGQAGLDTMAGGAGNDSYTVDSPGDVVIEADGEGTDTVFAAIDGYVLAANLEILVLSGGAASGSGNAGANQLYGNALANTLSGGVGNDTLVGGEGDDRLLGGADADLLFGEGGNDTLDGGEGPDQLVGGSGNDSILGGNGADLIWGELGADTIDGGAGDDIMGGGAGDDVYFLGDVGDSIVEFSGEGTDTVLLGIADYVVGANIEIVMMLAGAVQVFGNELANRIVGNGDANVIVGGAGADTLEGGGGDDWLFGDAGGNVFAGGEGNDTIVGSSDFATDVFRHGGAAVDGLDHIYGYNVAQGDVIDLATATYDVVDNFEYFSILDGGVEIVRVYADLADGVLIA
jgi:Ca2+-binding RTX toxin-like protein